MATIPLFDGFMMVYINSCSLLVCQMNIYWDSTHIDVNWRQFNVKMIKNTQNCQFLLCKWPQYYFLMVFIMVYIDSCSLLVCQINIYWDRTHFDVNWHQFNVWNDFFDTFYDTQMPGYLKEGNDFKQIRPIPGYAV